MKNLLTLCLTSSSLFISQPSLAQHTPSDSPLTFQAPYQVGTLATNHSGTSDIEAISADGNTIVGLATTNSGVSQAFFWHRGEHAMIGLGSLKSDDSGYSQARAISADGHSVVGFAATDLNTPPNIFGHSSSITQAFFWQVGDKKITGLGSLKADNSGASDALAISAEGHTVAGTATTDLDDAPDALGHRTNTEQAFIWHPGDKKMTGLGSLKKDNSGFSVALALSADGKTVAGDAATDLYDAPIAAERPHNTQQAFIWHVGDKKMTGLGSLKADDSGTSKMYALSADGQTVIGDATTDSGAMQAFIWHTGDKKMTGLGSLRNDNQGSSNAEYLSADGNILAGNATTDANTQQAFIWHTGDKKMTGLGSLKADNTGDSDALALSADGSTVVGAASTDNGQAQAFFWHQGDKRMTELGTLTTNQTGTSRAEHISADGHVITGLAQTDSGQQHAVVWKVKPASITPPPVEPTPVEPTPVEPTPVKPTPVEPPPVKPTPVEPTPVKPTPVKPTPVEPTPVEPTPVKPMPVKPTPVEPTPVKPTPVKPTPVEPTPVEPTPVKPTPVKPTPVEPTPVKPTPIIIIVDRDNTNLAMQDTARRGFRVIELYQNTLNSLALTRCQLGADKYCLGAFSHFDAVQDNSRITTGLFGAIRLSTTPWRIGAAINLPMNTHLMTHYMTRGKRKPGIGVFTRYQQHTDGSGLMVDLSYAVIRQDLSITRDTLSGTEAGEGNSEIKGYQAGITTTYGINISDNTQISPLAAITHHKIIRKGYSETRYAEFPAVYSDMGTEKTELQLGINAHHAFIPAIQVDAGFGANIELHENRHAFNGQIHYLGAYAQEKGNNARVRPYLHAALQIIPTPHTTVQLQAGMMRSDDADHGVNVGLRYSYHW